MVRIAAVLLLLTACGQLRDELGRAEANFDDARYEDALVWLDDLELQVARMEPSDRARLYYLRGMTALRLERRTEALHYLALAREETTEARGVLRDAWGETLTTTLAELTPAGATHVARSGGSEANVVDSTTP